MTCLRSGGPRRREVFLDRRRRARAHGSFRRFVPNRFRGFDFRDWFGDLVRPAFGKLPGGNLGDSGGGGADYILLALLDSHVESGAAKLEGHVGEG